MKKTDFAVKKGSTFTTFSSAAAAHRYWKSTVGGVLMHRDDNGKWRRTL